MGPFPHDGTSNCPKIQIWELQKKAQENNSLFINYMEANRQGGSRRETLSPTYRLQ